MQNTVEAKMPECGQIQAVKDKSQAIGEFIDWLGEIKGIHLCKWVGENTLDYAGERIEDLLAEHFGIDLKKVEQERRDMLEELRTQHARDDGDLKPKAPRL